MNLLWSGFLVALSTGLAVAALLLVRGRSPHGGHFGDTSRAAGVFSILATSFAVLFAFVVFFAFSSYDRSGSSAETEAQVTAQQFETAQVLPADLGPVLGAQLRCYARSVIHQEWPAMQRGEELGLNAWDTDLFVTIEDADPVTPAEQIALAKWFDQRSEREQAREERALGEQGVIPAPLWFVLLLSAAIVWAFVFLFADRGEGAFVQSVLIGAVTASLVSGLLLVDFLDHPYSAGSGSLQPTAMTVTLRQIDELADTLGVDLPDLCDRNGTPTQPD
jgi:hypothetical protein